MSNLANGHSFGIATPHFKSSMMAMQAYLTSGATPHALLSAAVSLTYNLPHLCGLGGDAIIMQSTPHNLAIFNGTGRTGFHQHHDNYLHKGLVSIPRRGIYSTMIYGCPSAYDRYTRLHDIDLNGVFKHLHDNDLKHGVVASSSLIQAFDNSTKDSLRQTRFSQWYKYFIQQQDPAPFYRQTLATLAREGFASMYRGQLAAQVFDALSTCDPHLYTPEDFSDFTPNPSEVKKTTFMHANVTAHGSNSPWKELFLLLKVYQWSAEDTALLTPAQLCTAAGLIDSWVASPLSSETHSDDSLSQQAALIYQQLKFDNPEPVPQLSKPSHTIFMACAEADGTLTGITNSIFTPLGSLFEIDDTGIILSNRAFSFNGPHLGSTFKGNTAAKHTTNCVRVTTDHLEFIIGTSGGPVQSQTLAYVIYKIIAEQCPVQTALSSPRFANLGRHPKTNGITYLSESAQTNPIFTCTHGLSDKFGVVQLAGINTLTGQVFAAADPRGSGVALAV